ncbi:MAG: L-threonate dehydrogenase [Pseudomonadota bacterium]
MAHCIAVIGLGSMGSGMAQSCLRAGLTTHGFDTRPEAMDRFVAEGGAKGSLADAAPTLDAAAIVVLNAAQTQSVLDDLLPRMKPGAVVLACATVPPDFARDMAAKASGYGIHYLDAPISGGSIKAAAGQLSIMASGSEDAFAAARPALDAMSETVFRIGDTPGAGSAMKAVNQLLAGVHIATMAEAMTFGISQGITPETFMEVIPNCAGSSWMLENRGPHIVEGDYTPHSQINIWPKDLGIVLAIAEAAGFNAPITQTALARYQKAVEMGLGTTDDAAVARVYAGEAGLKLPGDET